MASIIDRMQDERGIIEIKVDGDNVTIGTEYFAINMLLGQPCVREFFPGVFFRVSIHRFSFIRLPSLNSRYRVLLLVMS